MHRVRELQCAEIGLCHFESHINFPNVERHIADQYDSFIQEINYGGLRTLNSDFYNSKSDISLFYTFTNMFEHAIVSRQNEVYSDIKQILFKIVDFFEQIVFLCTKIVTSIETLVLNYISFYKTLIQDCEHESVHERAAWKILESLEDYQKKNILDSLDQIAEQPQCVILIITEMESKYMHLLKYR